MKKTSRVLASVLALTLALGVVGCSSKPAEPSVANPSTSNTTETPPASEQFKIEIGHIVNEDHTWHKASVKFKESTESKSNGALQVTIYPNNQLGSETEVIDSIMTGSADITFTGESMQSYIPEFGIMGAPYLITSDEHMVKVVEGEVGKKLEAMMLEKTGLMSLGYFARGPRNITSNKKITKPEDLKGMSVRVPTSPIMVAAMEALGAKATPMAFAEVFTSLQQGTIDGQENPLAMIKTGNFYEVQKYLTKSEHLRAWVYIVFGADKYNKMSPELQKIVTDAGKEMQTYEHELFLAEEAELEKFLQDKGMEFVTVDQAVFAAKAEEGILKVLTPEQKMLYDEIKAVK